MSRILLAFRAFFSILFKGSIADEVAADLGLMRRRPQPTPAPVSAAKPTDGALQMLAILQRDARLVDFLMEDISAYSDDQVGAAVRGLHDQAHESLSRYVSLQPVIDGVEGTFAKAPAGDGAVKFVGNLPAGTPTGGTLRHKGWRAAKIDLPAAPAKQDLTIVAPAEIEVE